MGWSALCRAAIPSPWDQIRTSAENHPPELSPLRRALGREKQPSEPLRRSEGSAGCKSVSGLCKYGVEMGFVGRVGKGFAPGAEWMAESSEHEQWKMQWVSDTVCSSNGGEKPLFDSVVYLKELPNPTQRGI